MRGILGDVAQLALKPTFIFCSIGGIIPLPLLVFSWDKSRWKYFAKPLIAATYSQDLLQRLKPKRINPALCQFVYIPCATGRSANKHEIETENQINHVTENESRWTNLLTKIKNIKNSTPPRNGLLLPAIIHAWPRAFSYSYHENRNPVWRVERISIPGPISSSLYLDHRRFKAVWFKGWGYHYKMFKSSTKDNLFFLDSLA